MASIQERIAALRQGVRERKDAAEGVPDMDVGSSQALRPAPARARRFGLVAGVGIANEEQGQTTAGAMDQASAGSAAGAGASPVESAPEPEAASAPPPSPAQRRLRGARLSVGSGAATSGAAHLAKQEPTSSKSQTTPTPEPAPPSQSSPQPLTDPGEWACKSTPAGSVYSEEQWRQAQLDNPDCTIFEMIKPGERALVAVPAMQPTMASLFTRSLVVDLRARHLAPWVERLASAHLEHASVEYGVVRYAIIRAASERERTAWLDGSVLRTADPGAEMSEQRSEAGAARASRFATAPRSAPAPMSAGARQGRAPETESAPRSRQFAAAIERMR